MGLELEQPPLQRNDSGLSPLDEARIMGPFAQRRAEQDAQHNPDLNTQIADMVHRAHSNDPDLREFAARQVLSWVQGYAGSNGDPSGTSGGWLTRFEGLTDIPLSSLIEASQSSRPIETVLNLFETSKLQTGLSLE